MRLLPLLLAIVILASACEETAMVKTTSPNQISGTWLQTEYGYSPGSGYYTKPVPAVPPQMITFTEDLQIQTNISGLTKYKFYRIIEDAAEENPVIAFFEQDPGVGPHELSGLTHSYSIVWEDNTLRLHYRWCFEGCHLGFRLLSDSAAGE
jgi:hypothetical protein